MNFWEIGYTVFAVITWFIVLIQILIMALEDAKTGKKSSTLVIALCLGTIVASGLALVWPILHLVLLLGVLNGGTKRKAGADAA